ncbi:hypothetical protein RMR16_007980 [Agrobacterium sp. rho-13.3]|jgi:hypothetical protein|nr:hypothetical protein [Agrobacterium sp. rho-13.3]MDX8312077.1 hypothetical protein [Agrobacterium sp. rho-13.3]
MAYDWSGGRTRRFRQLKLGVALGAFLLAMLIVQFFIHTSS